MRLVVLNKITLITAAIIEEVKTKRLFNQGQRIIHAFHLAKDGSLQCTCLVVVPVVVQAAVYFVKGILVATLQRTNLGSLKIASISPCLVPGGFPEEFVSLVILPLVFQCQCEVVDGFAVVWIGVTLLCQFHGLL